MRYLYSYFFGSQALSSAFLQINSQKAVLKIILKRNKDCRYGVVHHFSQIETYKQFHELIPITRYSDYSPYLELISSGHNNVVTKDIVFAFGKTSGTTSTTKLIPLTKRFINRNHFHASSLVLNALSSSFGFTRRFFGKSLTFSGFEYNQQHGYPVMDISAVLASKMPLVFKLFNLPRKNFRTWEQKIDYLIKNLNALKHVEVIAGAPTWILSFLDIISKKQGRSIKKIFPSLKVYIHGGAQFSPYRETFEHLLPDRQLILQETYNATEGYFAFQNTPQDKGLLLVTNGDIFYEFIPYEQEKVKEGYSSAIPLWKVTLGITYLMVITTTSGLYRYILGDLVMFKSLDPYKLLIVGRETEFVNAFGEDLSLFQVYQALETLQSLMDFMIRDFTIAPKYTTLNTRGYHEWYIEFEKPPLDLDLFTNLLDLEIQKRNHNYYQNRISNTAMNMLQVITLPQNTFENYLRRENKLGGQSKIKKLSNNREIVDKINLYR